MDLAHYSREMAEASSFANIGKEFKRGAAVSITDEVISSFVLQSHHSVSLPSSPTSHHIHPLSLPHLGHLLEPERHHTQICHLEIIAEKKVCIYTSKVAPSTRWQASAISSMLTIILWSNDRIIRWINFWTNSLYPWGPIAFVGSASTAMCKSPHVCYVYASR